jgi:hypothetical protein
VGGVLVAAQQHHAEHRGEHDDVLDAHRGVRVAERSGLQQRQRADRRDDHRGGHLPAGEPAVTAVAHPGDHRHGHREGHAPQEHAGGFGVDPGCLERDEPGDPENGHPEQHRDDHLEVVADEVGGGRLQHAPQAIQYP